MELIYRFNLKEYARAHEAEKKNIRQLINSSLATTGCLYIANTAFNQTLLANIQTITKKFFSLPLEEKNISKRPAEKVLRGYVGIAQESLSRSKNTAANDLNESFQIGPVQIQGRTDRSDENIWPIFNSSFKKCWEDYYREMENLSANMLDVFSDCLNISYDFFIKNTTQHTSRLRARFYPALGGSLKADQFRASPHTDPGAFTLLLSQKGTQGLEIFNPDKKTWEFVENIEGYFILNLGDLFARLTNDFWKAPLHRVSARNDHANDERLSILFFNSFNGTTLVKSFDAFTTTFYPSKYPPVTTADHLALKMS
jgi:isopenicillin N synthase-like dioxygenase